MSTILGPLPCQACRQPVWWQRRTMAFVCKAHGRARRVCTSESMTLTVVEEDGTSHLCLTGEQMFGIIAREEQADLGPVASAYNARRLRSGARSTTPGPLGVRET